MNTPLQSWKITYEAGGLPATAWCGDPPHVPHFTAEGPSARADLIRHLEVEHGVTVTMIEHPDHRKTGSERARTTVKYAPYRAERPE